MAQRMDRTRGMILLWTLIVIAGLWSILLASYENIAAQEFMCQQEELLRGSNAEK